MTVTGLSGARAVALRARAQLLTGARPGSVAAAVWPVVGLQAQDTGAARLAVRARTDGLAAADVTAACNADRSVVRTWAMRGTLHMLVAEDVGWLVDLFGPRLARGGRGRRAQLGLTDDVCERGLAALPAVFAGREPLVRSELVARLADHGVPLDPASQAPAHLLHYAAAHGLVCRGPDVGADDATYTLLADWVRVPGRRFGSPDEAVAELVRRYLAGHAPAAAEDFAAWSGLPLSLARLGFGAVAGELEPVEVDGRPAFVPAGTDLAAPAGPRAVRLLGHFDSYLLGYRNRELSVPAGFDRRVQAGGGWIKAVVLVDGRAVGLWRPDRRRQGMTVTVEPFGTLDPGLVPALRAEVADLGRFLGVDVAFAPVADTATGPAE